MTTRIAPSAALLAARAVKRAHSEWAARTAVAERATVTLYGAADVADALLVRRGAVSNWLARHSDTVPAPYARTLDGRLFWDTAGMDAWHRWDDDRRRQGNT